MTARGRPIALTLALCALGATGRVASAQAAAGLAAFERTIDGDPENLRAAADYRQAIIAAGAFDRSIGFFKKLAGRKTSGPNVHLSLALAYVDKVPTSGEMRRLFLARDALGELGKAIERRPTVLAYHVRGVINLFFNHAIFKRTRRGIADIEQALALVTADTPQTLVERLWVARGDGYWRDENAARAREIWAQAAARFPGNSALKRRLGPSADLEVDAIVEQAFDDDLRVDTTLADVI